MLSGKLLTVLSCHGYFILWILRSIRFLHIMRLWRPYGILFEICMDIKTMLPGFLSCNRRLLILSKPLVNLLLNILAISNENGMNSNNIVPQFNLSMCILSKKNKIAYFSCLLLFDLNMKMLRDRFLGVLLYHHLLMSMPLFNKKKLVEGWWIMNPNKGENW